MESSHLLQSFHFSIFLRIFQLGASYKEFFLSVCSSTYKLKIQIPKVLFFKMIAQWETHSQSTNLW